MTGPPSTQPLVFRNPNPHAAGPVIELGPCPWEGSTGWSVYVRDSQNLAHCLGDYVSPEAALDLLRLLFGDLTPIADPITRWQ